METVPTANQSAFCATCGTRLSDGARFCHRCGAEAGAAVTARGAAAILPWGVAALSLVSLVALLAGQFFGRRPAPAAEAAAAPAPAGMRAPDISALSPQERADRLFDRVMRYASAGQGDSAKFFAPMAIGALEALTPLTAPVRYQVGLVALATGDGTTAAAESDTILKAQPKHLLGLMLAGWTADARGDSAAKIVFAKRLVAADSSERARNLPEYREYETDIRTAVAAARGRTP